MRLVKYLKERFQYGIIVSFIAFSHSIFSEVIIIPPSENSQERLQEALILVNPGDVIQLTSGVYDLEDGLSLDVDDIKIIGEGHEKSILNFSDQKSGAQGLMVTSDNVILQDFAVLDLSLIHI